MASIVENKKYGENHKVQLKDKPTNVALFRKEGYRPGQTIFLITRKKVKVNKLLPLTDGNKSITLKDDKNKIVEITGSESSINGSFNHFSINAKSKTNLLTEIKEFTSLFMFQAFIEMVKHLQRNKLEHLLKKRKILMTKTLIVFIMKVLRNN